MTKGTFFVLLSSIIFASCSHETTTQHNLDDKIFVNSNKETTVLHFIQDGNNITGECKRFSENFPIVTCTIEGTITNGKIELQEISEDDTSIGYFSFNILNNKNNRDSLDGIWKKREGAKEEEKISLNLSGFGKEIFNHFKPDCPEQKPCPPSKQKKYEGEVAILMKNMEGIKEDLAHSINATFFRKKEGNNNRNSLSGGKKKKRRIQ